MTIFGGHADRRELAYGDLVFSTLGMLRDAVASREVEGETRADLARKIGMERSQLSRALNGRLKNLTLRTISDILFASGHTIREPVADAWESLSQAWTKTGPCDEELLLINVAPDMIQAAPHYDHNLAIRPQTSLMVGSDHGKVFLS